MNRLRCLIASALLLAPFLAGAQASSLRVDEQAVRFSFPNGHFLVELPIAHAGATTSAQLAIDLLDPQNTVRSHGIATCSLTTATTVCSVVLPPALPGPKDEDLAALRVRYVVSALSQPALSGILALDHIAPALFVLHTAAPTQARPGGFYTVRVRATNPLTNAPQSGVPLKATLSFSTDTVKADPARERKQLVTDRNGFATLEFTAPNTPALNSIHIAIEGGLANLHSDIESDISVPNQKSLTLTTDKPLYQPGQNAHFRLLALDRRGHAQANTKLTLDVNGPDNTLIFRTEATTSHFGIASADWAIPARLRLGNYSITAHSGREDDNDYRSAETEIRISRYDLPNFTVLPKPDKPFYLPGQNAAVEVRAEYLFGKPVVHGHVRVVRETDRHWDYEKQKYDTKEGAVYTGELGRDGSFTAHVDLSEDEKDYRKAEDPDDNAFTDLHLAAYVTDDSTGRTEQRRFDLRVTAQPLHVYFIQAYGAGEGLPIPAYVSVTTADGQPAANAHVSVSLLPCSSPDPKETLDQRAAHAVPIAEVSTNSFGLARLDALPSYDEVVKRAPPPFQCKPGDYGPNDPDILVTARTADARSGRIVQSVNEPDADFRIATDHALYKPGDPILVTITSTHPKLPVHLQLLRITQSGPITLVTQNLTVQNGRATLTFSSGTTDKPDPRFTGYLALAAVALGSKDSGSPAVRTVLFPRDNSLHVDVKLAHETYRPGDTASANIDVKGPQDPDGDDISPARTALGIVAVDQAVNERNRSDSEFGSGSSFFFPWRFPFYSSQEVAGVSLFGLERLEPEKPITPDLDLAAAVLLDRDQPRLEVTGNADTQSFVTIFSPFLDRQFAPIRKALGDYLKSHPDAPTDLPELDDLLATQKLSLSALRDPWGKSYHFFTIPSYGILQLVARSDGPDKQPGTDDDFTFELVHWIWFARHESDLRRAVIDYHQRTGSFIRDLPTLTAAMQADHIDFTTWRDPWGQPFQWTFTINQADYAISAMTQGAPPAKYTLHRSFSAGGASISWFTDERLSIQTALNAYTVNHPFPTTEVEFKAALDAANLQLGKFVDPWGHLLYAAFRTRSIFTDRIRVEARAHAGQKPQSHTTVTPVTAIVDTVDLRSMGPDGKRGDKDSEDDFNAASFSHERSQQSAKEASAKKTGGAPQSGGPTVETGDIVGTVSDASGAVIPNVSVVATNDATQAELGTNTDASGQYLLSPLPAGLYTVRFKAQGFQTTVIDQVHVISPDATVLDAELKAGGATETVEVTSGPVMLQTSEASITARTISQMQLGSLFHLSPGIARGALAPPPPPPPTGTPRVRDYFPETLLWRPEVLTDANGSATIRFPVADNITTWQLSVAGSTLSGNTGGGIASFRTFLPFFAALDPPQVLTTGDRIALPITLRNYLDHPIKVHSELAAAQWLRIDTPPGTTNVPAQDSASPAATITAVSPILSGKLLFTARPDGETGDSIERPVTVHPDGLETAVTTAGIVTGPTSFSLTIPADMLTGSGDATLKLYPNLSAHLRDALVAMAAYPDGCAEQIISIAWPSLLLQRYAAKLPNSDKQLAQQTRLKLAAAYANLLADRDSSGGFRYWPNDKQPDLALTAYAIQFLTAAREFTAVDDGVIKAAVGYLAKQQSSSGLWQRRDRDNKQHPEDTAGNAMLTASIAAMIAGAPDANPLIAKALAATQPFTESIDEPYTLANYAFAALAVKDAARSKPAIARLQTLALAENGGAYWNLETNTPFFGWGRAGRVETSAAALRALLASGMKPNDDLITRGLLFLDHQQDHQSLWYSTQATARTLDVLTAIAFGSDSSSTNLSSRPDPERAKRVEGAVERSQHWPSDRTTTTVSSRSKSALSAEAVEKPASKTAAQSHNELTIRIDGNPIATTALPPPDKDAGPLYIPLGAALTAGAHKITLDLPAGSSPATAQIIANLYQPWPTTPPASATANNEQLRLSIAFDNKSAEPNTPIHATAHIERLGFRGYGMLIAEIGLPPGADVGRASLETAVESSGYTLNHYEVLPDKLLLYLWPEAGGYDLHFTFSLRYPIDALTAPSAIYDYYNPDARLDVPPQRFMSGVSF